MWDLLVFCMLVEKNEVWCWDFVRFNNNKVEILLTFLWIKYYLCLSFVYRYDIMAVSESVARCGGRK